MRMDKTCWFVATFRLVSAGKSVLEVVSANVEDGQSGVIGHCVLLEG